MSKPLLRNLFRYLLTGIMLVICSNLSSQVTIGSNLPPEKGALLDLKEYTSESENKTADKGILLPRVKLGERSSLFPIIEDDDPDIVDLKESHIGLMVYNLASTPSSETDPAKILRPGIYTWDGAIWAMYIDSTQRMDSKFFYLPSFNLPISSLGTKNFNLYDEYLKQFKKADNTTWVSSNSNLAEIQKVYLAEELDYVVTGMADDSVVKINSISSEGVMSYEVLQTTADPSFYINIVLVVK